MPELFCFLKRILPRPITLSVVAMVSLLCGGGAAHAQGAIEASSASMAPGATSVATLSARAPRLSPAFQAGFDRSHRSGPTNLPHAAPAAAAPAGAPVLTNSLKAAPPAVPRLR
jgi:hypothetical protein